MSGHSAGNLTVAPSPCAPSLGSRKRIPFIMSSPRSGSTWLGKVFDSHPDVMYLHEPDITDRGLDLLPTWFVDKPNAMQLEGARRLFNRITAARSLRATGTRPSFHKSYRNDSSETARRSLIYLAKGMEHLGFKQAARRMHVPDFSTRGGPVRYVVKSVTAMARAEAFLRGCGDVLHPILLLRHPCGFVYSQLRGMRLGVMGGDPAPKHLLETRAARRLGARDLTIAPDDEVGKLAWNWLLSNAEAYAAIRAAGGTTVIYESLAQDPINEAKALFAEVDLDWAEETEAFLRRSAESEGSYYSVFRDPEKSVNGWRLELGDDVVARITAIVSRDPVGELAMRGPNEVRLAG